MMRGTLDNHGIVKLVGTAFSPTVRIETLFKSHPFSKVQAQDGTIALAAGGELGGGEILMQAATADTRVLIEGNTSTTYQVTGNTLIDEMFGSPMNAKAVIGTLGFPGPQLSFNSAGMITNTEDTTTEFASGRMTGTGSFFNEGTLNWVGGSIENLVTNSEVMNIQAGAIKTLKGTITQTGFIDFVYQSGTFTMQDGATVNNGANWVLFGGGSILASGLANAFHNTRALGIDDPGFAAHVIQADFNNTGTVNAIRGHLALTGDVLQLDSKGTLSGGTWIAGVNSSISFPRSLVRLNGPGKIVGGTNEFPDMTSLSSMGQQASAELKESTFTGDMTISDNTDLIIDGDVTINGDFKSTGGSTTTVNPGKKLEATGSMEIGELDSAADDLAPIAVIARDGTPSPSIVSPLLELWGGLRVGESGTSTIQVATDLVIHPTGRVHIKVLADGPSNTADRLDITGSATLDGTLVVDASEAIFNPGETLVVVSTSTGITSNFNHVLVSGLGVNQTMITSVVGNEVRLIATSECTADLNNDGTLDFFDVSVFLSLFGASDPVADLNNDGNFDFFDVSAFLVAFGTGCP